MRDVWTLLNSMHAGVFGLMFEFWRIKFSKMLALRKKLSDFCQQLYREENTRALTYLPPHLWGCRLLQRSGLGLGTAAFLTQIVNQNLWELQSRLSPASLICSMTYLVFFFFFFWGSSARNRIDVRYEQREGGKSGEWMKCWKAAVLQSMTNRQVLPICTLDFFSWLFSSV